MPFFDDERTVTTMPTFQETPQNGTTHQAPPLQDDAMDLLDSAREQGAAKLEEYRESAAGQIETLAQSAKSAAHSMHDNDSLGLSRYVSDVAETMTTLADQLRHQSADQLLQQGARLARDNPGLFITGSIALGFGLSRFLRASSPDIAATANKQTSSDTAENPSGSEFDSRTAADEDVVLKPAHTDDVIHSGQPGVVQPSPSPTATPTGSSGTAPSSTGNFNGGL
jgi:hypothetical protein